MTTSNASPTPPGEDAPEAGPHRTLTLKLTVNPAKSKAAPMSECSFLGFTIVGKKIRWTDKSAAQFKLRVRELTVSTAVEIRTYSAVRWRGWVTTGCERQRQAAVEQIRAVQRADRSK